MSCFGKFVRSASLLLALAVMSGSVAQAGGLSEDLGVASSVLRTGILQGIAAKELCSCMYVIRIGQGSPKPLSNQERLNLCLERASLPISPSVLQLLIWIGVNTPNEVRVGTMGIGEVVGGFTGPRAIARFEGDGLGCRLLTDEELEREW